MVLHKRLICTLVLLPAITVCGGCYNDVLDPTQIGRFRPVPVVNVILDSLGVADEPAATYSGTEEPKPDDLVEYEQDYIFGFGDVIRISIYELQSERTPFVQDYQVSETGKISIPDVGQVIAAGLTEAKLEQEIKDILYPDVLKDPAVTVLLMNSQKRLFSIQGVGVGRSGRFPIPRYAFRLTDAIAEAGGVAQFNVSYIYVSRAVSGRQDMETVIEKTAPETDIATDTPQVPDAETIELRPIQPSDDRPVTDEQELLEIIKPYTATAKGSLYSPILTATMYETAENQPPYSAAKEAPQIEWVLEDGKWIPVITGKRQIETAPQKPATILKPVGPERKQPADTYGLEEIGSGGVTTRVIKIPVDKLLSGDPKYNINIRPGDSISVPVDIVGEFWVTGNVNSSGVIPLTGRPMTLKMAIASAGGLNAIAWPKKVEVVRRIGKNKAGLMQEEIVMVDLNKIAKGLQPDFLIKPFDLINVGTHGTSRWLAELRNAFRATYGFGFIYDRNFASEDFGNDPFPGHIGPLNRIF